jgi:hypothetical protein
MRHQIRGVPLLSTIANKWIWAFDPLMMVKRPAKKRGFSVTEEFL